MWTGTQNWTVAMHITTEKSVKIIVLYKENTLLTTWRQVDNNLNRARMIWKKGDHAFCFSVLVCVLQFSDICRKRFTSSHLWSPAIGSWTWMNGKVEWRRTRKTAPFLLWQLCSSKQKGDKVLTKAAAEGLGGLTYCAAVGQMEREGGGWSRGGHS